MSRTTETVMLADTGRATTRLGYGCSSLMGALNLRESLALLEAAYDAGIRHFDVAPSYGFGAAESCLGAFLARHDDVTVTTKYGIAAAKNQTALGLARKLAAPLVRRIPAVKQRLMRAAAAMTAQADRPVFTAEHARVSMERSLKALGVERIDVWLLHEAEAADLSDESLLRFLEDAVAAGKIGTFGVGSEKHKMMEMIKARPEYGRVWQYEWSVLDARVVDGARFRIHHRALTDNFRSLHRALKQDAELCRRWSAEVGVDLAQPEGLAKLMLKGVLEMNPGSIVLVSSKNPAHIAENVGVVANETLKAPARRLHSLLQTQGVPVMRAIGVSA